MITAQDVADMTDLTQAEIDAIAEHEGLPAVNAACLAQYLLHSYKGPQQVQQMICDDIRAALHHDDTAHAHTLFATLKAFMASHPEAARGSG